ncbi:hypothetical protein DF22_001848 [Xylella fastidiosa]|nr:hypothetical protein DF22_001848 [Xylella fastidiosa]MDS9990006.1 hypothetical protein [Xylella fastidiosa]
MIRIDEPMYANPTHIRSYPVKVCFNDAERELIFALAQYNGIQPAALVRELALSVATAAIKNDKRQADAALEVSNQALWRPCED